MTFLYGAKQIIFLSFLIFYIKSDDVINIDEWDNNEKTSEFSNMININSYAFDSFTGSELFLINDTSTLYFNYPSNNNKKSKSIPNSINIKGIQPLLMKYEENVFYFCAYSDSFQSLIRINESWQIDTIFKYENKTGTRLKCI